jgi:AcrR family transcriptional regulator
MKYSGSKNDFSILPETGTSSRDRLLESAGVLFAAKGFREVSVREIAAHAGVNSALVGYYFRSKQALFNEVYRSHASPLAHERMKRLAAISGKNRRPSIEEVLRAWLIPWLQIEDGIGKNVLRIHFMVNVFEERWGNTEKSSSFTSRPHNAFIKVLQDCLPHLSRETLIWRLHFLVGAIVFGIRVPGPLKAVSKGRCDPRDLEASFNQILPYAVAGFCAPEPPHHARRLPLQPES